MRGRGAAPPSRSAGRSATSALVAVDRVRRARLGAGYWQVVRVAGPRRARPTTRRSSPRPGTSSAGAIVDRDGKVLASNKTDAQRRAVPGLRRTAPFSPVIGYASTDVRDGRPRAGLERRADRRLDRRPDRRRCSRKFRADPYDPQELTLALSSTLQQAAVAGARRRPRRRRHARPATGEVLALASTPTYDAGAIANPTTVARRVRGAPRRRRPSRS